MPFQPNGQLTNDRPMRPQGGRFGIRQGMVAHHMISFSVLRCTWNRMVSDRRADLMTRYLGIIGFGIGAHSRQIVDDLLGGRLGNIPLMPRDTLDECLCWQSYNLFAGPRRIGRDQVVGQMYVGREPWTPPTYHSPDPGDEFDFPIVAPPHGQRANTLWRVHQDLEQFIRTGAEGSLRAAFGMLTSVQHLLVISAHDVNWFALAKKDFWGMSTGQRCTFFEKCLRRQQPGVAGWPNGDEVFQDLFGGNDG